MVNETSTNYICTTIATSNEMHCLLNRFLSTRVRVQKIEKKKKRKKKIEKTDGPLTTSRHKSKIKARTDHLIPV